MKEIKLTQGQVALVDDEDFERLNQFRWCAMKNGERFYATRNIRVNGRQKHVLMHWDVIGLKSIDHIDHDGCNNQKSNLRACCQSENLMNARKRKNTTSVYKGVSFFPRDNKWQTRIKKIHIGLFCSEIDAAKAYNKKAIELFGEFANLNIINDEN